MNEPTTVSTDWILAALSIVLALRLLRSGEPLPASRRLWAASFFALAAAALVGGTWHAIPPAVVPALRYQLWAIMYTGICLADLLILAGAARAALRRAPAAVVFLLLAGRFLACATLVLTQRDPRYAGWDYLLTLLVLSGFGLDLARRGERGAGFVLAGVAVSSAGALVMYRGFSLHPRFDDNDLFHVIQALGVWLFFRAGLLIRDGLEHEGR